jgi:hypothetical protein
VAAERRLRENTDHREGSESDLRLDRLSARAKQAGLTTKVA